MSIIVTLARTARGTPPRFRRVVARRRQRRCEAHPAVSQPVERLRTDAQCATVARRTAHGRASQRQVGQWALTHRARSEEHTSELQSHSDLVCRLLLEKKKKK